jgi:hypothetical protein
VQHNGGLSGPPDRLDGCVRPLATPRRAVGDAQAAAGTFVHQLCGPMLQLKIHPHVYCTAAQTRVPSMIDLRLARASAAR